METDKRGKVGWVQRFITEADRAATTYNLEQQIVKLYEQIEKVRAIPEKGKADDLLSHIDQH
jgi:hypothetical protein